MKIIWTEKKTKFWNKQTLQEKRHYAACLKNAVNIFFA